MIFSFIKRAVIIPVLLTVVCVAGLLLFVNYGLTASEPETQDTSVNYRMTEYKKFSDLDEGVYVGSLRFNKTENDITYAESYANSLVLDSESVEPSQKGAVIIIGSGSQLDVFRDAKKGDTVSFDMYSNDSYDYKIQSIRYGLTLDEVRSLNMNGLIICRSYTDFSADKAKLYAVYIAGEVE